MTDKQTAARSCLLKAATIEFGGDAALAHARPDPNRPRTEECGVR